MARKRAQITLFIILGLMMLLMTGLAMYIHNRIAVHKTEIALQKIAQRTPEIPPAAETPPTPKECIPPQDTCSDTNTIMHMACINGKLTKKAIACPQGFVCKAGKCVAELIQTPPPAPLPAVQGPWLLVFTHKGTPMTQAAYEFICNTARPAVVSWLDREAAKYQKSRPFTESACLPQQVQLSSQSLQGQQMTAEGQTFTDPLDEYATINALEATIPALARAKYVTVFYYDNSDYQFADHVFNTKYDFSFIKTPNEWIPFYPKLTIDNYGEELIHELMHKLGATDKYDTNPQQACRINPETGQEYSGYDIMCHRVKSPTGMFEKPALSDLVVTNPTALEMNWITAPEKPKDV